jgi:hypothetical protein
VPFIEFRQQLYPLRDGENLLGSGDRASIRLPDLPEGCELGISVDSFGSFVWAAGEKAEIAINGQPLPREPVQLFNGDQIAVQDSTLVFPMLFIEDAGEPTVHIEQAVSRRAPAAVASGLVEPELLTRVTPPVAERKTVAVLRRQDDNQVYVIEGSSFSIGREKHCDLLIPDSSVSRLQAEITLSGGQYVLRAVGRVPTKVNDKKVSGSHTLRIGDVIKIREHEFAFLLRPITAEEIVQAGSVTPVRGSVPDAPTVMPGRRAVGGGRAFNYVLLTLLLAMLGLIVLG